MNKSTLSVNITTKSYDILSSIAGIESKNWRNGQLYSIYKYAHLLEPRDQNEVYPYVVIPNRAPYMTVETCEAYRSLREILEEYTEI